MKGGATFGRESGRTWAWLVGLAAVSLALPARAQTTTPTTSALYIRAVNAPNSTDYAFSGSSCSLSASFQWTYSGTLGVITSSLQLWSTRSTACGSAPGDNDVTYSSVASSTVMTTKTGQFNVELGKLPAFVATDGGVSCGATGYELTQRLCGVVSYQSSTYSGTSSTFQVDGVTLSYDSKPPSAPSISNVSSLDEAASMTVSVGSDVSMVKGFYRLAGETAWRQGGSIQTSSSTTLRIGNLTNGLTYELTATATDAAGNESGYAAVQSVKPTHSAGFFEIAKNGGNTDTGGCSTTGSTALLPWLGFVLLARRWRKR